MTENAKRGRILFFSNTTTILFLPNGLMCHKVKRNSEELSQFRNGITQHKI